MIILNEKEYAEECIRNKYVGDKPFHTLSILAKYYYHSLGYKKARIIELLTEFMAKYYAAYNFNRATWDDAIEKIVKNASKYKLYEIDGVWITETELKVIEGIHDKVLERLAFTILCLAKLGNIKNPNNNGWVNNNAKELFSMGRISCKSDSRFEKLCKLRDISLLDFPRRIDNLSVKVTFIDEDSPKKLFISDFRELGYEYLKYKGENIIRCAECGLLIRNNKYHTKKYCSNCSGYTPKEPKLIICVDCGKEIEVRGDNKRTIRCSECQSKRIKEYDRNRKRNH